MNILLINHYAGSTIHGMEYRPYYLASEWVKAGHSVMILAASYSHIRTHQPVMDSKPVKNETINGIQYRWFQTPEHSGNGFGRVKNIISFLKGIWKNTNQIISSFSPDVVIASSTYPMDIWPARHLAKRANAKLVYEVHDLWPLSPVELGGMSRWHPFIIWCQLAEDYAYRHSNKVISMLPKTLPYMKSRGMNPEKFNYIPNGINLDEWKNIQPLPNEVSTKINLIKSKGLPIIGYAGTHGLANALDVLLDAAKLGNGQFEVILVGPGPDRENLLKRIKNENIVNVTMLPAIPKDSIPAFLKEIDIAYIGLLPQPLFRFGISPNKLMDYMIAAKPIIMAIQAGNDPVSDVGCGITVEPGDARAVYQAAMDLSKLSPEQHAEMGEKGRKFILAEQTYSVLAKHFTEILEK